MVYIKLNDILGLNTEEINNSKIELNMQAGVGGEVYIDRWLYCDEIDKRNGTCPECVYWGWYGNQRNFRPGQWVFSFVRLRDDEWLFTSAAEIIEVPENMFAKVDDLIILERESWWKEILQTRKFGYNSN